jgi:hypothetical protein
MNLVVEAYVLDGGPPLYSMQYDTGNVPAGRDEAGEGVTMDGNGECIVAGWEKRNDLGQSYNWCVLKYAGPPAGVSGISVARVFPNPFRPASAAGGLLKFDRLPSGATVRVYTVRGFLVRELREQGGVAAWDGRNDHGAAAATGLYLYAIEAPGQGPVRGKFALVRP